MFCLPKTAWPPTCMRSRKVPQGARLGFLAVWEEISALGRLIKREQRVEIGKHDISINRSRVCQTGRQVAHPSILPSVLPL